MTHKAFKLMNDTIFALYRRIH